MFEKVSKGSIWPFGGLYKTLAIVFLTLPETISAEGDSISLLLIVRSSPTLKFRELELQIDTLPPLQSPRPSCLLV